MNETHPATRALRSALRVGAVMLLVVVAAWTGVGTAGDRLLRGPWYALRGERATDQQVMLVAIDAPTIAAWGAPPYRDGELAAMLDGIAKSGAKTVGVVEDPARLGALPGSVIAGPVALQMHGGAVEGIEVGSAALPTATARIAAAARIEVGETINYVGKRGLPTVSAIDVARGAIPKETFAGRIVVVGLTAQPYAGVVPTPVGPLAPAQVHAHALSAAADGVAWSTLPAGVQWLIVVLLCALAFFFSHRLGMVRATIATVLLFLAILVVDYGLFATGTALFGATLPIFAVLMTALVERVYERVVLQRHVGDIALWARKWMLAESMRDPNADEKPGYWRRVGELARLYVGATSSVIADLPLGEHHLELRIVGTEEATQIRERRLDVRRSPYRKAHLTLGPVWHDGYMTSGSTLMVPLIASPGFAGTRSTPEGSAESIVRRELVGFWMLGFASREAVTTAHIALVKTLAKEIARVIDRRRAPAPKSPSRLAGWVLGARPFTFELEDVKRAFHVHAQNQQDLLTLGEAMPFGVFVSTLWGDVRYANRAMKRLCTQRSIDLARAESDLAELLSGITLRSTADLHAEIRELVQAEGELYLRGDRNDVVLSWLGREGDNGERLIVGWVLPGSAGAQPQRTADEHAVTSLRRKDELGLPGPQRLEIALATFSSRPVDESGVTLRRPKLEPEAAVRPSEPRFAHGTPTFRHSPPRLDASELFDSPATLVPDATFKTPKVIVEAEDEEITMVPDEPSAPSPRATKRIFSVKQDS